MIICASDCLDQQKFLSIMNEYEKVTLRVVETPNGNELAVLPPMKVKRCDEAVAIFVTIAEDGFCRFSLWCDGIKRMSIDDVNIDRIVSDGEELLFRFGAYPARCVNIPLEDRLSLSVSPYWEICVDCDENE
ncbi:MAG: hypothetical protein ACRCWQ_10120 [Bacilli bacterium]